MHADKVEAAFAKIAAKDNPEGERKIAPTAAEADVLEYKEAELG